MGGCLSDCYLKYNPIISTIFYSNKSLNVAQNVYPLHVLRNFNYSDFVFYIIIYKH